MELRPGVLFTILMLWNAAGMLQTRAAPGDGQSTGSLSLHGGGGSVVYLQGTPYSNITSSEQCVVTGSGGVNKIEWWQATPIQRQVAMNDFMSTLLFGWTVGTAIQPSDAGTYYCRGQLTAPPIWENATGALTVTVAGSLQITSLPASAANLHGATLTVTCVATGYHANITWTGPAGAVFSTAVTSTATGSTGHLAFPSLTWGRDSGQFRCRASSAALCTSPRDRNKTMPCFTASVSQAVAVSVQVVAPGPVQALQERLVTSSSATLKWTPPAKAPLSGLGQTGIARYHIACTPPSTAASTVVARATPSGDEIGTVSGLPHFADINCTVAAEDNAGLRGQPVAVLFKTLGSAPSQPGELRLNVSGTAVTVGLLPPPLADRNGVLTAYNVSYETGCLVCPGCCSATCSSRSSRRVSITTADASATFYEPGLCVSQTYSLRVSACTAGGCGPSIPTYFVTAEGAPTRPESLTAAPINSSSVMLTWRDPSLSTFGPYRQFTVTAVASNPSYVSSACSGTAPVASITAMATVSPGRLTTYIATGLCPATRYSFQVTGENDVGSAVASIFATTREAAPYQPTFNLMAKSSSAILVQWNLPVWKRAGVLTGFLLSYVATCRTSCCCSSTCASNVQYNFNSSTINQQTTYSKLLDGLCSSTEYAVYVSAFNGAGQGAIPPLQHQVTLAGLPGLVVDSFCNVTSVDPYLLVDVTWKPPRMPGGVIRGYKLTLEQTFKENNRTTIISADDYMDMVYTLGGGATMVGVVTKDDTIVGSNNDTVAKIPELPHHSVYNIAEGSIYFYRIVAVTDAGNGTVDVVRCASGWEKRPMVSDPPGDTTVIVVVVVVLVLVIVAALVAAYMCNRRLNARGDGVEHNRF